jgi:hypothetical protein
VNIVPIKEDILAKQLPLIRKSTNITVTSPSRKVAVEATFKDDASPSSSNGDLQSPTVHRRSPDKGDVVHGGGSSTRLKFSTHTSLQPEAAVAEEAGSPAVSSTTGDEETTEISGDGPTSVQIVSQSPRRRSDSSVSGGGGNTEIEVFCGGEPSSTTSVVAASPATSVAAAATPALLESQATEKKKLMDEDVAAAASGKTGEKPELGGGSGKKGRVRAALDSVGLPAVCFYLVVWLSLFLFNAVCVCLLSVLVPCLWGGTARAGGCLLVPACPAWPATAAQFGGLPHPTPI